MSDSIVTLDVGGQIFKTRISTLTKYPGSMLAAMFNHEDEGKITFKIWISGWRLSKLQRSKMDFNYLIASYALLAVHKYVAFCQEKSGQIRWNFRVHTISSRSQFKVLLHCKKVISLSFSKFHSRCLIWL